MKLLGMVLLSFVLIGCVASKSDMRPEVKQIEMKQISTNPKIVCLDGFEYYYSRGIGLSWLAPKFNSEGKPSKCPVDDGPIQKAKEEPKGKLEVEEEKPKAE